MKKSSDKWNVIFGCTAVFGPKGYLYVFSKSKVIKMMHHPASPEYMVTGADSKYGVYITMDGGMTSAVKKKFVKII